MYIHQCSIQSWIRRSAILQLHELRFEKLSPNVSDGKLSPNVSDGTPGFSNVYACMGGNFSSCTTRQRWPRGSTKSGVLQKD